VRRDVLAFLMGILLLQALPDLPAGAWSLLLLAVIPLVFCLGGMMRLVLIVAAGFLWALWRASSLLEVALPAQWEGRDLTVTGVISGIPQVRERGLSFYFRMEGVEAEDKFHRLPLRVRLNWYGQPPPLRAGERWRLRVRLKQPRGFMNPGGFDYEGWLFHQGIRATGYVRDGPRGSRAGNAAERPHQRLAAAASWHWHGWRQALYEKVRDVLEDHPFKGMVAALALGERQGITTDQWTVLRGTGTTHLMAISGLHVGLVAGLAFWLVRRLWSCSAWLTLRLAAPRAAALGALLAAACYAALAGFAIPTQRALIMVAVAMAAVFSCRRFRPGDILALALAGVLLLDPLAVMAVGFWLSFGAVAVILYAMGGRPAWRRGWHQWGRLHWVAGLGIAPLTLLFFQQQALTAPLANFVAVPWVSLLVVPLVLLGACLLVVVPALGELLLQTGALLLAWLWPLLSWFAALPAGQWFHAPPLWAAGMGVVGLAWLLAPRGLPARWLGLLMLLPLFFHKPARPPEGAVWFTLLDVGQGLAAVVQTRDHVLVYDTGPRYSARFDTGAAVVVPFLRSQGIRRVDRLLLGHGDNDHIGGAASLLRALPVGEVLSSVPGKVETRVLASLEEKGGPVSAAFCRAGHSWQWNEVVFDILHPPADGGLRGNDASCVLKVSAGKWAVLLSGDIERRAEAVLVRRHGDALAAQVLVAPHHGSRTSSGAAFIDAVAPAYVLFPVGYRNRYGLPAREVLTRYRLRGVTTLDSARHGAIRFVLDARQGLSSPLAYRDAARRYWHGR